MIIELIIIALILLAAFIYDAEWLLCLWFRDYRIIVNCNRDPYLIRWYIFRSERVALFCHKFVRSDEERALHDHPWPFLVIPVWRGYIEHSDRPEFSDAVKEYGRSVGRLAGLPAEAIEQIVGKRIPVRRRVRPIIDVAYRDTDYRHRVELLGGDNPQPSWSLFFRFTKQREWGFWLPEGFVLWNKWWQDKCE